MNEASLRAWSARIATLAGIGYLPICPGTWATWCTLPLVYLISFLKLSMTALLIGLCVLFFCSYLFIWYALPLFNGKTDPSSIVLDECVGTLVTFTGLTITWPVLGLGFVLFRLFDIVKPFGIRRLEHIGGAFGILIDDVAAAVCAHILLRLYLWLWV